jgi:hypothetical protein
LSFFVGDFFFCWVMIKSNDRSVAKSWFQTLDSMEGTRQRAKPRKFEETELNSASQDAPEDKQHDRSHVSVFVGSIVLTLVAVVIAVVMDGILPAPRPADIPDNEYSEQRGRAHLEAIVGFGPRTVGSKANEVHTVKYLTDQVSICC